MCPFGTYADVTKQLCTICDKTCETCSGPTENECLTCKTYLGYMPKAASGPGQCKMKICPNGQYLGKNQNSESIECLQCKPECEECNGINPNYCTKCKKVYLTYPSEIEGFFECKSCNAFKGFKQSTASASQCEGKIKFINIKRDLWRWD